MSEPATIASAAVPQASSRTRVTGPLVSFALAAGANVTLWASDALWTRGGADDSIVSLLWLVGWGLLIVGTIVAGTYTVVLLRQARTRRPGWAWSMALLVACDALILLAVVAHLPWGSGSGSA